MPQAVASTLDQARVGETVTVRRLMGDGATRRRIMDMGVTKGTSIYIRKVAPLGDPIEVTIRGYELTLRKDEAQHIALEGGEEGASEPLA